MLVELLNVVHSWLFIDSSGHLPNQDATKVLSLKLVLFLHRRIVSILKQIIFCFLKLPQITHKLIPRRLRVLLIQVTILPLGPHLAQLCLNALKHFLQSKYFSVHVSALLLRYCELHVATSHSKSQSRDALRDHVLLVSNGAKDASQRVAAKGIFQEHRKG